MKRRAAIQRVGGGLAAVFLGACADGTKLLNPVEGLSDGSVAASRKPARNSNQVVGHTIFVTVEDTSIRVVPETITMNKRDHLRFVATNGRGFSIMFDNLGPFGSQRLSFDVAKGRLNPLEKGQFKYTVISDENPSLILDPVIIIEDPPTENP